MVHTLRRVGKLSVAGLGFWKPASDCEVKANRVTWLSDEAFAELERNSATDLGRSRIETGGHRLQSRRPAAQTGDPGGVSEVSGASMASFRMPEGTGFGS